MESNKFTKLTRTAFFGISCAVLVLAFVPKEAAAARITVIEDNETSGIVKVNFNWDEGIVDEAHNRLWFEMYYFFEKLEKIEHLPPIPPFKFPRPVIKTFYRIKARPHQNYGQWLSDIESEILEFDGYEYKIRVEDKINDTVAYATYDPETKWLTRPQSNQRAQMEPQYWICGLGGGFASGVESMLMGSAAGGMAAAAGASVAGVAIASTGVGLATGLIFTALFLYACG